MPPGVVGAVPSLVGAHAGHISSKRGPHAGRFRSDTTGAVGCRRLPEHPWSARADLTSGDVEATVRAPVPRGALGNLHRLSAHRQLELTFDTPQLFEEAIRVLTLKTAVFELSGGNEHAAELEIGAPVDKMVHAVGRTEPPVLARPRRDGPSARRPRRERSGDCSCSDAGASRTRCPARAFSLLPR